MRIIAAALIAATLTPISAMAADHAHIDAVMKDGGGARSPANINLVEKWNPKGSEPKNLQEPVINTKNKILVVETNIEAIRPPVPKLTKENNENVRRFMEPYPDYQQFTAKDMPKLSDLALRTIVGTFSFKLAGESLVPDAFIRQYGADAAGEFALAAQREAVRRGKAETYAISALNFGLHGAVVALLGKQDFPLTSDVPAQTRSSDGKPVRSTAPKILNYEIATKALGLIAGNDNATSFEVVVPPAAVVAVARGNNLPTDVADRLVNASYPLPVADEMSFLAGYASRAGASSAPVNMPYKPSAVCQLPQMRSNIFNPNLPDISASSAFAAGYITADLDLMPAAQRNAVLGACPPKNDAAR